MYKVFRLALREYLAAVRTKGFIIGLIMLPIFMSGSMIAMAVLKDHVDIRERRIVIVDETNQFRDMLQAAAAIRNSEHIFDPEDSSQVQPVYNLEFVTVDTGNITKQLGDLSDRVRDGDIHAFLHIGSAIIHPVDNPDKAFLNYHAESAALDDIRGWLRDPINNYLRRLRLEDAGIDEARVPDLFQWSQVSPKGLLTVDEEGNIVDAEASNEIRSIIVPLVMMMLMFMMSMMGAMPQLSAVMEEKTQRIVEVILGSITPFQFMLGKILGGLAVALTSTLIYLGGGISFLQWRGFESYIPYDILPWFIINLIILLFMLGALMTSLGSVANDAKDAQSLSFPAMFPMMIPMFIMVPVLKEPLSSFATIISLIPPFTPMVMTLRLASPVTIPSWQPWAGLAGVLVFTLFVVWGGARIFRAAILMQGVPLKFSNIMRWMTKG
ncbi:MAG: ABC transporter permease [Candidatus Marinimicrobia bacterium]|nr:ABC transporter permease [Candidatus Neomarinimicrobiota bacterium]